MYLTWWEEYSIYSKNYLKKDVNWKLTNNREWNEALGSWRHYKFLYNKFVRHYCCIGSTLLKWLFLFRDPLLYICEVGIGNTTIAPLSSNHIHAHMKGSDFIEYKRVDSSPMITSGILMQRIQHTTNFELLLNELTTLTRAIDIKSLNFPMSHAHIYS